MPEPGPVNATSGCPNDGPPGRSRDLDGAARLRRLSCAIRSSVLHESQRANVGHIGSCLSIADLLSAVYGDVLRMEGLADPQRDRFILSKGHAALALYAALHHTGWLSGDQLRRYCTDGTEVSGHPEHRLAGIEFTTGSLGLGLGLGAGTALGARLRGADHRVFVLISDAECNEGSLWEAVMFAAHHRLSNLVALLDLNGQQALGRTGDILDISALADCWRSFGWDVHETDGHDPCAIARIIRGLDTAAGPPHVLLARTVFGKGVSFMEGAIRWHYWPMSDEDYSRALLELSADGSVPPVNGPVK